MKIFATLLGLFAAALVKGQISLGPEIFPQKGDTLPFQRTIISPDEIPLRLFDTTSATFNVDLSAWEYDEKGNLIMEDPKKVPSGNEVPKAELAYRTSFGNLFFNFSDNNMNIIGIAPALDLPTEIAFQFDSAVAHIESPLEYLDRYNASTTSSRDLGFLKVEATMNAQYQVNGYGTIISPDNKSVEVLRVRRRYEFEIKTIPIAGSPTIEKALFVNWEFYADSTTNTFLRAETRYTGLDTVVLFDFADQNKTYTTTYSKHQNKQQQIQFTGQSITLGQRPSQLAITNLSGKTVLFEQNQNHVCLPSHLTPQILILNWISQDGNFERMKLFYPGASN